MTTIDAVHVQFFPNNGRDAAKSTIRRLKGSPPRYRFLQPEPLDARRVYYRLTASGARLIGAPKDVVQPLGVQALVQRYALLWFICIERPHERTVFNPRKFPEQFPIQQRRLPRQRFYIETDGDDRSRLGCVLVDHRSDDRRLVRKAGQLLQRFLCRHWFDDFIKAGAFELTVLTATEAKRQSLKRALSRRLPGFIQSHLTPLGVTGPDPLPVHVTLVPGLADILPGTTGEGQPL